MSTHHGFGTMFYDWEHFPEGDSEATKWLVAGFFPIIPLGRVQLQVHTSGEKPSFFSLSLGSFDISYDVLEEVPTTFFRIMRTYVKGWILTPVVLLAPMFILVAIEQYLLKVHGINAQKFMSENVGWFVVGELVYFGVVVASILDKATGRDTRVLSQRVRHSEDDESSSDDDGAETGR